MRTVLTLVAAMVVAACSRDRTYEAGGTVDTTTDTTARLTIPEIDVGLRKDTLSIPTFGTVEDTLVVRKPAKTGEKQVEIKRPTVDVKRKP